VIFVIAGHIIVPWHHIDHGENTLRRHTQRSVGQPNAILNLLSRGYADFARKNCRRSTKKINVNGSENRQLKLLFLRSFTNSHKCKHQRSGCGRAIEGATFLNNRWRPRLRAPGSCEPGRSLLRNARPGPTGFDP
jgi:hypothetical protein